MIYVWSINHCFILPTWWQLKKNVMSYDNIVFSDVLVWKKNLDKHVCKFIDQFNRIKYVKHMQYVWKGLIYQFKIYLFIDTYCRYLFSLCKT